MACVYIVDLYRFCPSNPSPRPDRSTLNVPPSLGDTHSPSVSHKDEIAVLHRSHRPISAIVAPVAQPPVVQCRVHDMSRDKTQQRVMPAKAARQDTETRGKRQRQTTAPRVTCALHTDTQAEYPPSPISGIISADLLVPCLIPHLGESINQHSSNNRRASRCIYPSYPVPVGGLVCPPRPWTTTIAHSTSNTRTPSMGNLPKRRRAVISWRTPQHNRQPTTKTTREGLTGQTAGQLGDRAHHTLAVFVVDHPLLHTQA